MVAICSQINALYKKKQDWGNIVDENKACYKWFLSS